MFTSANTETFGAPARDSTDAYQTENNSGASENSDNTVIFLPPYKHHNHLGNLLKDLIFLHALNISMLLPII